VAQHWLQLSSEKLNPIQSDQQLSLTRPAGNVQRRLSSTIGSNNGNPRIQPDIDVDAFENEFFWSIPE